MESIFVKKYFSIIPLAITIQSGNYPVDAVSLETRMSDKDHYHIKGSKMKNELIEKYRKIRMLKLGGAVLIDVAGFLSAFFPIMGDMADPIWAGISGILIYALFPKRIFHALGGAVEELLPFTDVIPTASSAWFFTYVVHKEKTLSDFIKDELGDEQLVTKILNEYGYSESAPVNNEKN